MVADVQTVGHATAMPINDDRSSPNTDADRYGFVLAGLFDVIDDGEALACDPQALMLLYQARDLLWAEFQRRHPGSWDQGAFR